MLTPSPLAVPGSRVSNQQDLLNKAILASVAARREWDLRPVQDRAQILFKAADVISGPKRAEILAKTMIGQVRPGEGGGGGAALGSVGARGGGRPQSDNFSGIMGKAT